MNQKPVVLVPEEFPVELRSLLRGARTFDSSCSSQARVYFIDRDDGFYLKIAAKNALKTEEAMTRYYHSKGLSAQMVFYLSDDTGDWMLTQRIPGEDGVSSRYLAEPKRLCDTFAEQLGHLHELPVADCPVPDRMQQYIATVQQHYQTDQYDSSLFPDNWGYASAKEAIAVVRAYAPHFRHDVLLHGDYCLPNILLADWRFSGLIDVGNGGVGDRHLDLFWGIWSLQFNLKTDAYTQRFLDAYGRDRIEPELLRAIAACEVFA